MKIFALHADRLRLRFCLECLFQAHRPPCASMVLVMELANVGPETIRTAISRGDFQVVYLNQSIKITPGETFFSTHRTPKINSAARPCQLYGEYRASAHIATSQTNTVKQEGGLGVRTSDAQV